MQFSQKFTALAGAALCAVGCSLLAPPDSEFMGGGSAVDSMQAHVDAGPDARSPESGDVEASADVSVEAAGACRVARCPVNTVCKEVSGTASCVCSSGFVGYAGACRRAISCDELHTADPGLPSGRYLLTPLGSVAEIPAYCEMVGEGGGWTLILNQGTTFDPKSMGDTAATDDLEPFTVDADGGRIDAGRVDSGRDSGGADAGSDPTCFERACVSPLYALVRVRSDVMLDVSNLPIAGARYAARVVIDGIGTAGRGKTLRELFTTGPYFMEAEDNSNVTVRVPEGLSCAEVLSFDLGHVLCDSCQGEECGVPVLVFGDSDSVCATGTTMFAIGAAHSPTLPWTQCAGWPQAANYSDYDFYPDDVRVWLR